MIIKINHRVSMTCVKLVDICGLQVFPWKAGCEGRELDAYCEIYRAGCKDCQPVRKVWCGCRYTEVPAQATQDGIAYDAFQLDDDGRVCFYWDHLLFDSPAGRYDVKIFAGGAHVDTFQIELRDRTRVSEVVNKLARRCANC